MATASPKSQDSAGAHRETYSFALTLSGVQEISEAVEQSLYECGCDDALLSTCDGQASLAFDREADSLVEAIRSAIADVEKNKLGIKVVQVVPPGENIINAVNALLILRGRTPELSSEIEALFNKWVEHRQARAPDR